MVANFPGIYAVEINYTGVTIPHKMLLSINVTNNPAVGDAWNSIDVTGRSGLISTLDSAVSALLTKFADVYNTSQSFGLVELYRYTEGSYDRTFISSKTFSISGTSANSSTAYHQNKFSFRSTDGGVAYITLLESSSGRQVCDPYANMNLSEQGIVDEFSKPATVWLARDDGFPFSFMRVCGGQNEKLWRIDNR